MVSFNPNSFGLSARISDSQFRSQQGSEALLGLANRVRPDMTPQELIAVQQQEKEIVQRKIENDINYEYTSAWQESLETRRKKDLERRQRLLKAGVLFG